MWLKRLTFINFVKGYYILMQSYCNDFATKFYLFQNKCTRCFFFTSEAIFYPSFFYSLINILDFIKVICSCEYFWQNYLNLLKAKLGKNFILKMFVSC